MRDAVLSLIAVLIFAALAAALKPSGSLGKSVGFLCSLFVLMAVISPFLNIGYEDIKLPEASVQKSEEGSAEWLVENSAMQIGKSVSELVEQKFGYAGVPVTVTLDTTDISAVRLLSVSVDLRAFNAVKRVYEIEAELKEKLACEVEVTVR